MNPALRRNIGLLLEGHVQYQFMNITQIERVYASFYPGQWKKEAYYDLMNKLKVAPDNVSQECRTDSVRKWHWD